MKKDSIPISSPLKPVSFYKNNLALVKLVLLFFVLGLAIHFLSSRSFDFIASSVSQIQPSPSIDVSQTHFLTSDQVPQIQPSPAIDSEETNLLTSDNSSFIVPSTEVVKDEPPPKCDLFKGDWIPNPSGPDYTNYTCEFIEYPQNCMTNGRPDSDYLYWKWSPRDCELPKFDPQRFLNFMRNKSWAFIGDSISRNHVQSMLCILSKVEPAKEIYHDEPFKSRTWIFPSYNFKVAVIWAPFLIRADIFEDNNGVSSNEIQLHLDKIEDKWLSRFNDLDYAVIAAGKWFLKSAIYYENNQVQGCHYCPGKNLTEIPFDYAYRKALGLIFNYLKSSSHKALVFFRTITPDHFEHGEWHNGGNCTRTLPFKEGQSNMSDVDRILHAVELDEFNKAVNGGPGNGVSLKLVDSTYLSLLRPDGHPGPYRQYQPFAKDKHAKVQNDCLHWCLPGPIDTWNDILAEMVMNPSQDN